MASTCILSAEDEIVAALRRIMRAVDIHSRRLVGEHGLTGPQLATLREIGRLRSATVGSLAKAIHLSQPTVTGIVDRLEKRGLITRHRDKVDRRQVNLVLTQLGRKTLAKAPSLLQDRFKRQLADLAQWEQTMTLATLQRIATMMEADALDAAPLLVAGPLQSPTEPGGSAPTPTQTRPSKKSPFAGIPRSNRMTTATRAKEY